MVSNDALVLASASAVRARLLREAGLAFVVEPAAIDEAAIKRRFRQSGRHPRDCAFALAAAKATQVSARHPRAIVVGADQILVCGAEWLDKPADREAARDQLKALRGRRHVLETVVCAARGGEQLWTAASSPRLRMRQFGDQFLESYLAAEGDLILGSVGAYRLEGRGIQLFECVEGDYFAILGLPLIPLLDFLRDQAYLAP
jgi:nucleoside triphosphate pyrophosphatase